LIFAPRRKGIPAGFELSGRRILELIEEPFRRMQNGARWKHALPEKREWQIRRTILQDA
jgi:hypothetical protein